MDELDPIRELVVEAMAELEQGLVDGLPAQAPMSGKRGIEIGLAALRERTKDASKKFDRAELILREVGYTPSP